MPDYSVVLCTCANRQDAVSLGEKLVDQKLAACVQVLPVESIYRWQGEVKNESEVLMLIKTRTDLFASLESFIKTSHTYEIPEIIQLPVDEGSADYLNWIDESTS